MGLCFREAFWKKQKNSNLDPDSEERIETRYQTSDYGVRTGPMLIEAASMDLGWVGYIFGPPPQLHKLFGPMGSKSTKTYRGQGSTPFWGGWVGVYA